MNIENVKREIADTLYEVRLFRDQKIKVSDFSESAKDLIEDLKDLLESLNKAPKDFKWEISIPLSNISHNLKDLNGEYLSISLNDFLLRINKIYAQLVRIKEVLEKGVGFKDSDSIEEDKVNIRKKAQQYANRLGKPVVYGYTSKRNPDKFFSIKLKEYDDGDDNAFRSQYSANLIYVAYPDKR